MKNHYDILGLSEGASLDEIKKAYRKLSIKFHPDKNENDLYFSDMFKRVTEAYETLSDSSKRKAYDRKLKSEFEDDNIEDDYEDESTHSLETDPLFLNAAAFFVFKEKASASMLQKQFKLDFARVSHIMMQLEHEGIIGKYKGAFREVLVDKNYLESTYNFKYKESDFSVPDSSNRQDNSDQDDLKKVVSINRRKGRLQRKLFRWFLIIAGIGVLYYFIKDDLGDRLTEINRTYFNDHSIRGTVTSPNGLNMRSKPSNNAKVILTIPTNSDVLIIDENGPAQTIGDTKASWYKVLYNNEEGWVWGGYIQKQENKEP